MKLSGVHLLLTYQCNYECDHCFVWSSPQQSGTMRLRTIREILRQAEELGTVDWIYFEGGEPFLCYGALRRAVEMAAEKGFRVGLVSNAYWATDRDDAEEWLRPLAGRLQDLSVSSDLYHSDQLSSPEADYARAAAEALGIPIGVICIAQPEATDPAAARGQLPIGESAVMYRGRAVEKLAPSAQRQPWSRFDACPHEDLREPGRVHVDPFGEVHICQGISLGNVLRTPLREICERYEPDSDPITGPILAGGPAELVRRYALEHAEGYADACHLCYEARCALRSRFPASLTPGQMYGVVE
jgi:hypothetical protein